MGVVGDAGAVVVDAGAEVVAGSRAVRRATRPSCNSNRSNVNRRHNRATIAGRARGAGTRTIGVDVAVGEIRASVETSSVSRDERHPRSSRSRPLRRRRRAPRSRACSTAPVGAS